MTYFLLEFPNKELRKSVCSHIVGLVHERKGKNQPDDVLPSTLCELISPLMIVLQDQDKDIAILACTALINLTSISKESKYMMMRSEYPRIIVEILNPKKNHDQNLLFFSLHLIYNLSLLQQHLEQF